ncbi:MAG TPA: NAD(P)-dependent oxidoreductase [Xanthobacteraceae bacterium]|nr:NAD(P)-dependent oxidoreductase [Xanthobacteraceae bacterium]
MKVGFIGLGRMGEVMTRRLLDAGNEVGVYNRTAAKLKPLVDAGAKPMASIKDAAKFGDAVFTMLGDDAAVLAVVGQSGGLKDSLPAGGIHICAGTHSIAAIEKLNAIHRDAGQVLITSPMFGRPEVVVAGQAGIVVGGPAKGVARCRPLFAAIAPRVVEAGADPASAAVIKIANNFVLGCAIEALGEGFSLVRKYGIAPDIFNRVLTEGLFACGAYKIYGTMIAEERYLPAGQSVKNGLKDANLALSAGEAKGVPLPSGNIWRDRLVGALAHGEADHDWAVMAHDQARASGLA